MGPCHTPPSITPHDVDHAVAVNKEEVDLMVGLPRGCDRGVWHRCPALGQPNWALPHAAVNHPHHVDHAAAVNKEEVDLMVGLPGSGDRCSS